MYFIFHLVFPDFIDEPSKDYLKTIRTSKIKLEWYYKNLLTSQTLDEVVITINEEIDTICRSDNIADIYIIKNDSIILSFYGSPKAYGENIQIENDKFNLNITIDTSAIGYIEHRNTFSLLENK